MNLRTLGRTGLEVTELSLGGLFTSRIGGEFEQTKAAVHRALDLGVNYIDTAAGYANSEETLGRILEDVETPLVLSTKLGYKPEPFDPQDTDCLMRSVETSLERLHRDCIDILMIHEPDRQKQFAWWTDMETFDGPVMELLDTLKKNGTIRFTGLGGTTAYQLPRIMDTGRFDVVLTAFNYSLLWREGEHEIFPVAKKHDMGVVAGSPLQQGALARRCDEAVANGCKWLSAPRREQFKALYAFLDEIDMPIVECAMRFVVSNPAVSCVLTGARSAEEVESNVASIEKGPLPEDVLARLDEIAAMVPFRPYEEPFGLPLHQDGHLETGAAHR